MRDTACNAGDVGSIPRSGRSPGEGHNLETKPAPPAPPPPLSCSLPVWGKGNITHLLSQKNALNRLLSLTGEATEVNRILRQPRGGIGQGRGGVFSPEGLFRMQMRENPRGFRNRTAGDTGEGESKNIWQVNF